MSLMFQPTTDRPLKGDLSAQLDARVGDVEAMLGGTQGGDRGPEIGGPMGCQERDLPPLLSIRVSLFPS